MVFAHGVLEIVGSNYMELEETKGNVEEFAWILEQKQIRLLPGLILRMNGRVNEMTWV